MDTSRDSKSGFIDYAFLRELDVYVTSDIVGEDVEAGLKQLHAGVRRYFAPETIVGHLVSMMYGNMEHRYSQYQAREISDCLRKMLKAYRLQSSGQVGVQVDDCTEEG